jgi:hypothetical protein
MMKIASSVPLKVSGLSGRVRANNSDPGQRKASLVKGLVQSVRGVRAKHNSLIYAHPRVSVYSVAGVCFSYRLSSFYTGHSGQKEKVSKIVGVLVSGQRFLSRTLPGHPGQWRLSA